MNMQIEQSEFEKYTLSRGSHTSPENGMCAMELVAHLSGEPFSDRPECVSRAIGAFTRNLNDQMNDQARNELLRPALHLVLGTNTTLADEKTRAFMAADWAIRVSAPTLLRALGRDEWAAQLEAIDPIVDLVSARSGKEKARKIADAANASANSIAAARDAIWVSAVELLKRMCEVGR